MGCLIKRDQCKVNAFSVSYHADDSCLHLNIQTVKCKRANNTKMKVTTFLHRILVTHPTNFHKSTCYCILHHFNQQHSSILQCIQISIVTLIAWTKRKYTEEKKSKLCDIQCRSTQSKFNSWCCAIFSLEKCTIIKKKKYGFAFNL